MEVEWSGMVEAEALLPPDRFVNLNLAPQLLMQEEEEEDDDSKVYVQTKHQRGKTT